jgi:phytoene synthase
MHAALAESNRYCETVARREAANFYPAFRLLPSQQRLAMCALYTFMRIADDCSDEDGPLERKTQNLDAWRRGLHAAMRGDFAHPSHAALADTVHTHKIPVQYLDDVVDGVAMDLGAVHYETWDDLRLYCYRVAAAVGLACIHIWGFSDPSALVHAEQAGYAFQLTNILRDLKEDAGRGRIYLPADDLRRFGYAPEELRGGVQSEAFRALMRFETERAKSFYDAGAALEPLLAPPGRAVFLMMARTYRQLLNEIEARDYDVFSSRVRVSSWKKLRFALAALPVRFGFC